MKKIISMTAALSVLFVMQAHAAARIAYSCEGADQLGNKVTMKLVGRTSLNTETMKTVLDGAINADATRPSGQALVLRDAKVTGLKTIYSSLVQYSISLKTTSDIISIAINNKNSSVFSVYNVATDSVQEFSITCK